MFAERPAAYNLEGGEGGVFRKKFETLWEAYENIKTSYKVLKYTLRLSDVKYSGRIDTFFRLSFWLYKKDLFES